MLAACTTRIGGCDVDKLIRAVHCVVKGVLPPCDAEMLCASVCAFFELMWLRATIGLEQLLVAGAALILAHWRCFVAVREGHKDTDGAPHVLPGHLQLEHGKSGRTIT